MISQHAGMAEMARMKKKSFISSMLKMIAALQRSLLLLIFFCKAQGDLLADPTEKKSVCFAY